MLAVSTSSVNSHRQYPRATSKQRAASWSRRAVPMATAASPSANYRKQQHQVESDVTMDDRLSHKVPRSALITWPDVLVVRLVTSRTLAEDSESDGVSWDETEDERKFRAEDNDDDTDDDTDNDTDNLEDGRCRDGNGREEMEGDTEELANSDWERDPDDEVRWWKSREEKRTWEKRYWQADAAFRRRFGCAIDTAMHPEVQRTLRQEETPSRTLKLVLASLVLVFVVVQVALVVSAPLWMESRITLAVGKEDVEDAAAGGAGGGSTSREIDGQSGAGLWPSDQVLVPKYVHTGLHLCAKLSRRVVESERDIAATQHALRACDIAANFAPESSRESIEAHVRRGDLHSLLLRFDRAEEDYKIAATAVQTAATRSTHSMRLLEDLDIKILANRWTQLYTMKRYEELRREAKARVAQYNLVRVESNFDRAASELAANWLRAFKQKKPVVEVLTLQRSWTLRSLEYEALEGVGTSVR